MTGPTWYEAAKNDIGLREIAGPGNSPTIMGWAKRLGVKILGIVYNADSLAWCGLAMANWINQRGLTPPSIAVRAKSWATWGRDLGLKQFYLGSVLVFERKGGGHVGMCAGYTATHLKVLGGNQGDAVSYTWIVRDRCIAQRWPSESTQVPVAAPRYASVNGPVSDNEK